MSMPARSAGLHCLAGLCCWLSSVKHLTLSPQRDVGISFHLLGCACRPCIRSPGFDHPCCISACCAAQGLQHVQTSMGLQGGPSPNLCLVEEGAGLDGVKES